MAHLWTHDARDDDALGQHGVEWSYRPLDADVHVGATARLHRATTADGERWVAVGPPSVRVNGLALDLGIVVLRDRDEIRARGGRMYFSTESLAVVVPYPRSNRPSCARCKLEIDAGSPAVACPQCRVWYHQSDELPCWTYAERCAFCDQATALDAGFKWTPEEL